MPALLAILAILLILALWAIFEQRRLVVLDENINSTMNQIGVQLSNRFDALMALLDLTRGYEGNECETLFEAIQAGRSMITPKSTPDDVQRQEEMISDALARIALVTEQYPELKANPMYIKATNAVQIYENMVRTSCLIYNDNVTKLNRETRMFPVSMFAGILGFRKREYLL